MRSQRLWMAAPYAILLAIAGWFYHLAAAIEFSRQGDNLGPDFWPRAVLIAMMAICAVQAARILFTADADQAPVARDDPYGEEEHGPRSRTLLAIGLALTIAYGALLTSLGFLTATVLFLALFMYAGRYRAHAAIWISSLAGAALLTLIFQKIVYVSLPRGVFPFDRVTDALLGLF